MSKFGLNHMTTVTCLVVSILLSPAHRFQCGAQFSVFSLCADYRITFGSQHSIIASTLILVPSSAFSLLVVC